jgi:inner membrane protein involved in colicin E2 resistance
MHLKNERAIIYAIVLIPLTFVIILLFALFPDFVFRG